MDPVSVSYARWGIEGSEYLAAVEEGECLGVEGEGSFLDGLGHTLEGGVRKGAWEVKSVVGGVNKVYGDSGRVVRGDARNARHIWWR
jgi:hypothetical protein